MDDREIFEKVEEFMKTELADVPFDKGLPKLQDYIWNLGGKVGKTGQEVLAIYFDIKSSELEK